MKIGIISGDRWLEVWSNYGTLFQNFALQTFLRKSGHETFWILTASEVNSRKGVFRIFIMALKNPLSIYGFFRGYVVHRFFHRAERKFFRDFNSTHPRHFNEFFEKYVPHSETHFSESDLLKNPPFANAYIVGSDQVWGAVTPTTFLGFGESSAIRLAYAVSTAWGNRSKKWIENARKMLPNLDAVSVREPEGIALCKKAGREDVLYVADPTLLLDKEDYMKIVRAEGKDLAFPRRAILAYFLNVKSLENLPWKEVVECARERSADLKVVPLQGAELAIPEEFVFTPSPAEWLNAYDKSDCVITNSFHGTAFAIIMRKPFLVVLQKGQTSVENCRFKSILGVLGLEERIFDESCGGGGMSAQMDAPIAWDEVSEKIEKFRNISADFLHNALALRKTP